MRLSLLLGYILSTKTPFSHSHLFNIMCTLRRRRNYDEQKAVVVEASLPALPMKRETS